MKEGVKPRRGKEFNLDEGESAIYMREGVQSIRGRECNLYEQRSAT